MRPSFTRFAYALFVVLGIVTTLLGPILPLLTLRWSITSAQAGSLFSWQSVACTLANLISGLVLSKRSFRFPILLGVGLCLAGVVALIFADWSLGRYAVACYGFGLGVALPAINLAVAETNPQRRAASVSVLNFAWGIGAISGPVLLRLTHAIDLFLATLSVLLAIALAASVVIPIPGKSPQPEPAPDSAWNHRPWRVAPLIAFSMFLMVGAETSVTGWASSLALPHFSDVFTANDANIAFWTFFLASRLFSPTALRFLSESKLFLVSLLTAALGVIGFYFAVHVWAILIACAIAGAGIGPGFPILISRVSELIGSHHPIATICFAFAGFGAAVLPTSVGLLGNWLSQPRAGLLLPLAAICLLIPIARSLPARDAT